MGLAAVAVSVRGDESVVLFDAESFADESLYPLGDLRPVAHGEARWTPAAGTAQPGRIVVLDGDRFPRALRRYQTGQQATDADLLDFAPTTASWLTVSFDARVWTADSRTLDLHLLRPGEFDSRHQASVRIWGHRPGKRCYFDGEYREAAEIDTAWRRYELVHDLAAKTFDPNLDGPWSVGSPATAPRTTATCAGRTTRPIRSLPSGPTAIPASCLPRGWTLPTPRATGCTCSLTRWTATGRNPCSWTRPARPPRKRFESRAIGRGVAGTQKTKTPRLAAP